MMSKNNKKKEEGSIYIAVFDSLIIATSNDLKKLTEKLKKILTDYKIRTLKNIERSDSNLFKRIKVESKSGIAYKYFMEDGSEYIEVTTKSFLNRGNNQENYSYISSQKDARIEISDQDQLSEEYKKDVESQFNELMLFLENPKPYVIESFNGPVIRGSRIRTVNKLCIFEVISVGGILDSHKYGLQFSYGINVKKAERVRGKSKYTSEILSNGAGIKEQIKASPDDMPRAIFTGSSSRKTTSKKSIFDPVTTVNFEKIGVDPQDMQISTGDYIYAMPFGGYSLTTERLKKTVEDLLGDSKKHKLSDEDLERFAMMETAKMETEKENINYNQRNPDMLSYDYNFDYEEQKRR